MVYEIPKLIRDDDQNAHTFIMGKRVDILCRQDFWGDECFTEYYGKNDRYPIRFYLDDLDNILWEFETIDIHNLFFLLGIKVKAKYLDEVKAQSLVAVTKGGNTRI